MWYKVKNNKVVDNSKDIEAELQQFMKEEEAKVMKEIMFRKKLQEKSKVLKKEIR